jgi:hypothetical protein
MFEVLTAHGADALKWQHVWDRLPHDLRDVHYCPAYGRVQEALGGRAMCAVYEWEAWIIMQPFMLRDIGETGYRDMTSMYGHGGPVSNMRSTSARSLAEWMEVDFARWRGEQKVVSEFCALHPMMAGDQIRLIHPDAVLRDVRQTVAMRIDCTDEVIAAGMRADRRQNLVKASAMQIGPVIADKVWDIYTETMQRHHVAPRWRFPLSYFRAYNSELWPDRAEFIAAYGDDNTRVSASLLLFGHHHAHYQFTGNDADAPRGANDRIIMEAARLARRAGCTWLLLGGGTTSAESDSLLAFKAGFSKHRFMARNYRRIFDREAYIRLSSEAGRDPTNDAEFFPAYRAAEAA